MLKQAEGAISRPRGRRALLALLATLVLGAGAWTGLVLLRAGYWPIAILAGICAVVLAAALVAHTHPAFRWLTPTILLLTVLVAYPAVYVGYLAFTNYSSQHPVPQQRAVEIISTAPVYQVQVPGSPALRFVPYRDPEGALLFWLTGSGEAYLGQDGQPLTPVADAAAAGLVGIPNGLPGKALSQSEAATRFAPGTAISVGDVPLVFRTLPDPLPEPSALPATGLVMDPQSGVLLDLRGDRVASWKPSVYAGVLVADGETVGVWAIGQAKSFSISATGTEQRTAAPDTIGTFAKLPLTEAVSGTFINEVSQITLGRPPELYKLNPSDPTVFGQYTFRYAWDASQGVFIDTVTGAVYRPLNGYFTLDPSTAGSNTDLPDVLRPGFVSFVGLDNFRTLATVEQSTTIIGLMGWSLIFAGGGVLFAFLLGLGVAILLNDPRTPLRGLARALFILPYAMPVFLTVTLWRFFFDPTLGPINNLIRGAGLPFDINWTGDPTAARVALMIIMTWVFFPYFMLVAGGALQSINPDLFGAAAVDGANALRRFWHITLPLVVAACGPILIATFAFFFSNVTVIQLFLRGGPPVETTGPSFGATDILASFAYHQAFPPNGDADFGYASAVALVVFLLLGALSWVQIRLTRVQEAWHEGS